MCCSNKLDVGFSGWKELKMSLADVFLLLLDLRGELFADLTSSENSYTFFLKNKLIVDFSGFDYAFSNLIFLTLVDKERGSSFFETRFINGEGPKVSFLFEKLS